MSATAEATKVANPSAHAPIVVDMGKKRKKEIKQLSEGRGELMAEVNALLEELRSAGSISASAQPVVIVVRQKRKPSLLWPLA